MKDRKKANGVTVNSFQSFSKLDPTLEAKDVKRKDIVVAKVICWDNKRNGMVVIFGNQLSGFIPKSDISIYPSYDRDGIPSEATYVIGKTIIVEVVYYNMKKKEFVLSRVKTMKKRLETIRVGDEIIACITKIRNKDFFVEVGPGVLGRVDCREISQCFVDDMSYFGYSEGCKITLKVIGIEGNKLNLSRKRAYPKYDMSLFESVDIVDARILSELTTSQATSTCAYAYCTEVGDNPNIKEILDSDIVLSKGTIVRVRIKDVSEKGLRLRLVSI